MSSFHLDSYFLFIPRVINSDPFGFLVEISRHQESPLHPPFNTCISGSCKMDGQCVVLVLGALRGGVAQAMADTTSAMFCTESITVPLPREAVHIRNSCICFLIILTSLNLLNLCSVLADQLAEVVTRSSMCY